MAIHVHRSFRDVPGKRTWLRDGWVGYQIICNGHDEQNEFLSYIEDRKKEERKGRGKHSFYVRGIRTRTTKYSRYPGHYVIWIRYDDRSEFLRMKMVLNSSIVFHGINIGG